MRCSQCGFDNPEGFVFYGKCGHKLANLCPTCGFENPTDLAFCGKCGQFLTAPVEPTPPPVSPAEEQLQRLRG